MLAENNTSFFHSLPNAAFCIRNFHRLRHGNKVVHQVVVSHWIKRILSAVILMISWKRRFQTLPCGLVSFHNASILGLLVGKGVLTRFSFPWLPCGLSCHHLARHRRFHKNFQFPSCVYDGLFTFSIFWIDEAKTFQFSSVVESASPSS